MQRLELQRAQLVQLEELVSELKGQQVRRQVQQQLGQEQIRRIHH
jgi:hypothetical protein